VIRAGIVRDKERLAKPSLAGEQDEIAVLCSRSQIR